MSRFPAVVAPVDVLTSQPATDGSTKDGTTEPDDGYLKSAMGHFAALCSHTDAISAFQRLNDFQLQSSGNGTAPAPAVAAYAFQASPMPEEKMTSIAAPISDSSETSCFSRPRLEVGTMSAASVPSSSRFTSRNASTAEPSTTTTVATSKMALANSSNHKEQSTSSETSSSAGTTSHDVAAMLPAIYIEAPAEVPSSVPSLHGTTPGMASSPLVQLASSPLIAEQATSAPAGLLGSFEPYMNASAPSMFDASEINRSTTAPLEPERLFGIPTDTADTVDHQQNELTQPPPPQEQEVEPLFGQPIFSNNASVSVANLTNDQSCSSAFLLHQPQHHSNTSSTSSLKPLLLLLSEDTALQLRVQQLLCALATLFGIKDPALFQQLLGIFSTMRSDRISTSASKDFDESGVMSDAGGGTGVGEGKSPSQHAHSFLPPQSVIAAQHPLLHTQQPAPGSQHGGSPGNHHHHRPQSSGHHHSPQLGESMSQSSTTSMSGGAPPALRPPEVRMARRLIKFWSVTELNVRLGALGKSTVSHVDSIDPAAGIMPLVSTKKPDATPPSALLAPADGKKPRFDSLTTQHSSNNSGSIKKSFIMQQHHNAPKQESAAAESSTMPSPSSSAVLTPLIDVKQQLRRHVSTLQGEGGNLNQTVPAPRPRRVSLTTGNLNATSGGGSNNNGINAAPPHESATKKLLLMKLASNAATVFKSRLKSSSSDSNPKLQLGDADGGMHHPMMKSIDSHNVLIHHSNNNNQISDMTTSLENLLNDGNTSFSGKGGSGAAAMMSSPKMKSITNRNASFRTAGGGVAGSLTRQSTGASSNLLRSTAQRVKSVMGLQRLLSSKNVGDAAGIKRAPSVRSVVDESSGFASKRQASSLQDKNNSGHIVVSSSSGIAGGVPASYDGAAGSMIESEFGQDVSDPERASVGVVSDAPAMSPTLMQKSNSVTFAIASSTMKKKEVTAASVAKMPSPMHTTLEDDATTSTGSGTPMVPSYKRWPSVNDKNPPQQHEGPPLATIGITLNSCDGFEADRRGTMALVEPVPFTSYFSAASPAHGVMLQGSINPDAMDSSMLRPQASANFAASKLRAQTSDTFSMSTNQSPGPTAVTIPPLPGGKGGLGARLQNQLAKIGRHGGGIVGSPSAEASPLLDGVAVGKAAGGGVVKFSRHVSKVKSEEDYPQLIGDKDNLLSGTASPTMRSHDGGGGADTSEGDGHFDEEDRASTTITNDKSDDVGREDDDDDDTDNDEDESEEDEEEAKEEGQQSVMKKVLRMYDKGRKIVAPNEEAVAVVAAIWDHPVTCDADMMVLLDAISNDDIDGVNRETRKKGDRRRTDDENDEEREDEDEEEVERDDDDDQEGEDDNGKLIPVGDGSLSRSASSDSLLQFDDEQKTTIRHINAAIATNLDVLPTGPLELASFLQQDPFLTEDQRFHVKFALLMTHVRFLYAVISLLYTIGSTTSILGRLVSAPSFPEWFVVMECGVDVTHFLFVVIFTVSAPYEEKGQMVTDWKRILMRSIKEPLSWLPSAVSCFPMLVVLLPLGLGHVAWGRLNVLLRYVLVTGFLEVIWERFPAIHPNVVRLIHTASHLYLLITMFVIMLIGVELAGSQSKGFGSVFDVSMHLPDATPLMVTNINVSTTVDPHATTVDPHATVNPLATTTVDPHATTTTLDTHGTTTVDPHASTADPHTTSTNHEAITTAAPTLHRSFFLGQTVARERGMSAASAASATTGSTSSSTPTGALHVPVDREGVLGAFVWYEVLSSIAERSVPFPESESQVITSLIRLFFSIIAYAVIVTSVEEMVVHVLVFGDILSDKLESALSSMEELELPPPLQHEVITYYRRMWDLCKSFDGGGGTSDVMQDFPDELRGEIEFEFNARVIRSIPLFAKLAENVEFVRLLAGQLNYIVVTPGCPIVEKGEEGDCMYFLTSGDAAVMGDDENDRIATLRQGSFFGETTMLFGGTRPHTIIAVTLCVCYVVMDSQFDAIVDAFPEALEDILAAAVAQMKKQKQQTLIDIPENDAAAVEVATGDALVPEMFSTSQAFAATLPSAAISASTFEHGRVVLDDFMVSATDDEMTMMMAQRLKFKPRPKAAIEDEFSPAAYGW